MQVEDHPIGYMDFEGTIPQGEYGGGTVMVWDIGTYHVEDNDECVERQRADEKTTASRGNIKIILEGGKLHGEWHLVDDEKDDATAGNGC
jgi:bifunctional non-homologous end joining protein LigD